MPRKAGAHLQARQSFRLISAFSRAFFAELDVEGPGPARVVEYVETS
jgi:hypothetical protein